MKRYQRVLVVFFGLVVILYIVSWFKPIFQVFTVPTTSNEPNIRLGDRFFASMLKEPKRFDFICYRFYDPMEGSQIRVHRLCGVPGDVIEVRNDTLFVNGQNEDQKLNLKKFFVLPSHLVKDREFKEGEMMQMRNGDSVAVSLETINDRGLIRNGRPYIDEYVSADEYVKRRFGKPWNAHNFGPYRVPADSYFVLGDNRDFSQDSRYVGPIPFRNYYATALK